MGNYGGSLGWKNVTHHAVTLTWNFPQTIFITLLSALKISLLKSDKVKIILLDL